MKVLKEDYNSCNPYGGSSGDFAGILKPEATQRKCSLIYIPKIRDNTNDFWTSVISGCKMAGQSMNLTLKSWLRIKKRI